MSAKEPKLALCWYQPDQWEALKALVPDQLDGTYEQWRCDANRAIQDLNAQGKQVQKVSIKIDSLLAWCKANDLVNDSSARSRYAAELLSQR